MNKDTFQILGISALIVVGLVVAVFFLPALLIGVVAVALAGTTFAGVIGVPTFLISLCLEWSIEKASERTVNVVVSCYGFALELVGPFVQ